jgi:3-hydroxyacyl-[acyl-carrier-protein] dehydratase
VTTPAQIPPSDTAEILKHIPHRYPFMLIDRMEACEPKQWVRVIKNISHNDEFFAGVPLDRRVMPQLLLLESLAQAAGVLCHYSGMMSRIGKTIFFFAGFDKCRFGRDVVPGDQLLLECTMARRARCGQNQWPGKRQWRNGRGVRPHRGHPRHGRRGGQTHRSGRRRVATQMSTYTSTTH